MADEEKPSRTSATEQHAVSVQDHGGVVEPPHLVSQTPGYSAPRDWENLDELTAADPVRAETAQGQGSTQSRSDEEAPESEANGPSPPTSQALTQLYTISYLVLFSLLGTLARLGLSALTTRFRQRTSKQGKRAEEAAMISLTTCRKKIIANTKRDSFALAA
jgi:hypothetical protein